MSYKYKIEIAEFGCSTVSYKSGGRSLAELGITLVPGIRHIAFTNVGDNTIYVGLDTADGNSYRLVPFTGMTLRIRANMASRLRFYCGLIQSSVMNIQQEGD